jgi:SAM-dependent methyltransferase
VSELPEHVRRNRSAWDGWAAEYVEPGERAWATDDPTWGIWGIPEADVEMLPADASGLDTVELGCGTAYVSAWLARRGARPVGIDNSEQQLVTARRLQAEHGLAFPLHHGNAEQTPFGDESFDIAISEYGASIWCDPYLWIPEAARILRPGGRLVFLINAVLVGLCSPEGPDEPLTDRLLRPLFGMHRFDWVEDEGESVNFTLPHGEMIRLLRETGFVVEELRELQAPPDATTSQPWVDAAWANRWPAEEVWKARKG